MVVILTRIVLMVVEAQGNIKKTKQNHHVLDDASSSMNSLLPCEDVVVVLFPQSPLVSAADSVPSHLDETWSPNFPMRCFVASTI